MPEKKFNFEKAYERLNKIKNNLEEGNVDVDGMEELLAEAMELIKKCREKLKMTKMKVINIMESLDKDETLH